LTKVVSLREERAVMAFLNGLGWPDGKWQSPPAQGGEPGGPPPLGWPARPADRHGRAEAGMVSRETPAAAGRATAPGGAARPPGSPAAGPVPRPPVPAAAPVSAPPAAAPVP